MKLLREINILGTKYTITQCGYEEDPTFKEEGYSGYCNNFLPEIVIGDLKTFPDMEGSDDRSIMAAEKEALRHEIVHAFFNESGLQFNTGYNGAWAKNEEMVDWIAIQGPKIYEAWKEADAL